MTMTPSIFAYNDGRYFIGFIIHDINGVIEKYNDDLLFQRDMKDHGLYVEDGAVKLMNWVIPKEDRINVTWELFTAFNIQVGKVQTKSKEEWEKEILSLGLALKGEFVA